MLFEIFFFSFDNREKSNRFFTLQINIQYLISLYFGAISLPWNEETPLGYSAEIGFNIAIDQAYMISNGALLLLFISICMHHQAFHQIICQMVTELNDSSNEQQNENKKNLAEIIRFQMMIKE